MNRSSHCRKSRRSIKSSQSGFMLIESILAVSLLCTIIYTTTSVMSHASRSTFADQRKWIAAETATMVIEELSFAYSTTDSLSSGLHSRYYDSKFNEVTYDARVFTVSWSVVENTPIQGILSIDLAVNWMDGPNERTISFKTLR